MLTLFVKQEEFFNEETQKFVTTESFTLELEHSLVALSKWESKHNKSFLNDNTKTSEEILSYVRCMIISPNPPEDAVDRLSINNFKEINEYIEAKQTATTFGDMPGRKVRGEVITSELIYYWMVAFSIPFVCETWHLNRLFALIRICNVKNAPPTKMSRGEMARRNRELNEKRKAELGTSG